MALTKTQKKDVMQKYITLAKNAKNVVLILQKNIKVNDINTTRKNMVSTGGKICAIRKRIFLKAMQEA